MASSKGSLCTHCDKRATAPCHGESPSCIYLKKNPVIKPKRQETPTQEYERDRYREA